MPIFKKMMSFDRRTTLEREEERERERVGKDGWGLGVSYVCLIASN